jgi:hypothetical protein
MYYEKYDKLVISSLIHLNKEYWISIKKVII